MAEKVGGETDQYGKDAKLVVNGLSPIVDRTGENIRLGYSRKTTNGTSIYDYTLENMPPQRGKSRDHG